MMKVDDLLKELIESDNPTATLSAKYDELPESEMDATVRELQKQDYITVNWGDNKPWHVTINYAGMERYEELKIKPKSPRDQLRDLISEAAIVERMDFKAIQKGYAIPGVVSHYNEWKARADIFNERYLKAHPLNEKIKIACSSNTHGSFDILRSSLIAVETDEEYWNADGRGESDIMVKNNTQKERKILISHSSYDAKFVERFVELLEVLGLRQEEIICSSVAPYCIPLSNNIYKWLVDKFQNYDLHVIYMLSHNYYESAASLNEMGAAWAMAQDWDALLLPGFNFSEVRGCIDPQKIAIKLDDEDFRTLKFRLDELKNNLVQKFGLRAAEGAFWERHRDNFISDIATISNELATKENIKKESDTSANDEGISFSDLVLLSITINEAQLIYLPMCGGVGVSAGSMGGDALQGRRLAKWDEAIEILLNSGFIHRVGKKDKIYEATNAGYNRSDELKDAIGISSKEEFEVYLKKAVMS